MSLPGFEAEDPFAFGWWKNEVGRPPSWLKHSGAGAATMQTDRILWLSKLFGAPTQGDSLFS